MKNAISYRHQFQIIRWRQNLYPYYNPNLTLEQEDFSL